MMDQSPFPVARTKDGGRQRLRPRGAEVAPYLGWTAFNVDAAHLRKRIREGLSLGPSDYSTLRAALAMDWDCSEVDGHVPRLPRRVRVLRITMLRAIWPPWPSSKPPTTMRWPQLCWLSPTALSLYETRGGSEA